MTEKMPGVFVTDLRRDEREVQLAIAESELAESVRRALEGAAERDAGSMKRLRLAVAGFTVALRDLGTTPERVLIALKTVIDNRSFVPDPRPLSDWTSADLRERITTWCIEEFFRKEKG
ncbi:MAG: hypothetical protein ACR2NS_12225 [Gemmatimonadaceae bacterium]